MQKRFKAKKRNKYKIFKFCLFLLIVYGSFNLVYKTIYKKYIAKLDNKEIIEHIIANTKNNKLNNKFINVLQDPNYILKNNFTLKKENVSNENVLVDNDITNKEKEVQVYIYSTHETESYSDKYLEVYNIKPTVLTMNYILNDYLSDYGIKSYVENQSVTKVLKDNNWSYKFSYEASKIIAQDYIKQNPSLKLIIDLHRDSSGLDKTIVTYNGQNYAKILFVVGLEHENYEKNLELATNLSTLLEKEIPGITRGVSKKGGEGVNGIYNQDLSDKAVLIELGGQYNEIEELNNSLEILAKTILKYLEGEI